MILDKVVINFYMFGAVMLHRIMHNAYGYFIIKVKVHGSLCWKANLSK